MQITLELPEDIVPALTAGSRSVDGSRTLTSSQLRRLLGFETRMQVDEFLKAHDVYDFTAADFEWDSETLCQLRQKRLSAESIFDCGRRRRVTD